jgi:hypothetical protein
MYASNIVAFLTWLGMLPARAKYLGRDRKRAEKYFNTPKLGTPAGFPLNTLPVSELG